MEGNLEERVARHPPNGAEILRESLRWPAVRESLKRWGRVEASTKLATVPFVPPVTTGVNYLVRTLTQSAKWASTAGGVTEWGLETLAFYGLMHREYRKDDGDAQGAVRAASEIVKDCWLAEGIDYVVRPFFTGLGQYLAAGHAQGQHPYRTWLGTIAGIVLSDLVYCTAYLVTRHIVRPLASRGPARSGPSSPV